MSTLTSKIRLLGVIVPEQSDLKNTKPWTHKCTWLSARINGKLPLYINVRLHKAMNVYILLCLCLCMLMSVSSRLCTSAPVITASTRPRRFPLISACLRKSAPNVCLRPSSPASVRLRPSKPTLPMNSCGRP